MTVLILLLVTIVNMVYTSRVKLAHGAALFLVFITLCAIIGIVLLVIKGWCNAFIALVDISAALASVILAAERMK